MVGGPRIFLGMLLAVVMASGCAPKLPPPPQPWPIHTPSPKEPIPTSEGSLWVDRAPYAYLFQDHKARNVGDVVTVKIVESAKAARSASTKTSRDSSLSAAVTAMFGAPLHFGLSNLFGGGRGFNPKVAGSLKNEFDGTGTTEREDTFVATITAKVVEVLPGGLMRIEGYREVIVNNERHYILLRGIVRPEDISANNVVLSTAIADAQIAYTGRGILSDKQRPGWLTRILDHVWPF